MRKITLLLAAVFFTATFMMAQPPAGAAKKGTQFGEKIAAAGAVSPDKLPEILEGKETAEVKVKGTVAEVCKARGCFLYLKTAKGKIYIKTKDDAFFVPLSLSGKTVVVKGVAEKDKDNGEISIQATGLLVV